MEKARNFYAALQYAMGRQGAAIDPFESLAANEKLAYAYACLDLLDKEDVTDNGDACLQRVEAKAILEGLFNKIRKNESKS